MISILICCLQLSRIFRVLRACSFSQSCLNLCNLMDCSLPGSSVYGIFPGRNTGVGHHFILQGIFWTQGSNPHLLHLLHWQRFLYHKHNLRRPVLEPHAYNVFLGVFLLFKYICTLPVSWLSPIPSSRREVPCALYNPFFNLYILYPGNLSYAYIFKY